MDVDLKPSTCYASSMPPDTASLKSYEATVMLRITKELTDRLDRAVVALSQRERGQGRARRIGRATIVYEAMKLGLPRLEKEVGVEEDERKVISKVKPES